MIEQDSQKTLANPYNCLTNIDGSLSDPHEPAVSELVWVKTNARLISQIGAELWLTYLLENLKGNFPK